MYISNSLFQLTLLVSSMTRGSAVNLRGTVHDDETRSQQQQRQLGIFGPHERTNTLRFEISCGTSNIYQVTKFDCTTISHEITSGQPWNSNNVNCYVQDGSYGIVEIKAGRHNSHGPANYFKDGLTYKNMITDIDELSDHQPSQLNFAATLNITLAYTNPYDGCEVTYEGSNIRVGQGHNSNSRNNWWIGGETLTLSSDNDYGLEGVVDSNQPSSRCSSPASGSELVFIPVGTSDILAYTCY